MPSTQPPTSGRSKSSKPANRPDSTTSRIPSFKFPKPMKPLVRYEWGRIFHLLALILAFAVPFMFFWSWIGVLAKVSGVAPTGDLVDAPWLLIMSRSLRQNNTGTTADDAAGKAVPRYGISAWKICRWSYTPEDLLKDAQCIYNTASMGGGRGELKDLEQMKLSETLHDHLPWAANMSLGLLTLLSLSFFICLALSFAWPIHRKILKYDLYTPAEVREAINKGKSLSITFTTGKYHRGKILHCLLRSGLLLPLLQLIALIPFAVTAGVGQKEGSLDDKGQPLELVLGSGGKIIIAALALQSIAHLLIWFGGLKVDFSEPGHQRSKKGCGDCFSYDKA